MSNDAARRATLLVTLAVALIFGLHVALLWLANAPGNPLTPSYIDIVDTYARLVAPQGWAFFAPNPHPWSLHVVYRVREGRRVVARGDLTERLAQRLHANPFTPDETLYESLYHATAAARRSEEDESPAAEAGRREIRRWLAHRFVEAVVVAAADAERKIDASDRIEYAVVRRAPPTGAPVDDARLSWHTVRRGLAP